MRRFGRQCRGQGKGFVSLVRQTETQVLETGPPLGLLARAAQEHGQSAVQLAEDQRERLDTKLKVALEAPHRIASQSRRRTHGKPLPQGKIVTAYAPPIAPICNGKSNCPTPFGRQPGIIAEPATGFLFAGPLPVGNPSAASFVLPVVDKGQGALAHLPKRPTPVIHSVAGDLARKAPSLRTTLHSRGILTVGIPHTVDPLSPAPPPEEIRQMLNEAGLTHTRTPHQVQLACACGYSRPVVERVIASLLSRGAARLTYKGQRGAIVQIGRAVLAHNAATVRRIHQDRLSKRAQKFRRLLRLKRHKANEFKSSKN